MAITKAMLARCQNELKQAFCALDKDVQDAIRSNATTIQWLDVLDHWTKVKETSSIFWANNAVYRLSPDTPTEPEVDWVEYDISIEDGIYFVRALRGSWLWVLVACRNCLGIVYRDSNGVETLRTSVDIAFGTPVRVRFRKEVTK